MAGSSVGSMTARPGMSCSGRGAYDPADSSLWVPEAVLDEIRKHATLKELDLRPVGKRSSTHSEFIELRDPREFAAVLVKRAVAAASGEAASATVQREFDAIARTRMVLGPGLEDTLPVAYFALPEHHALVLEKIDGDPLTALLRRQANRLTGPTHRSRLCRIAAQIAGWLRRFHEVTRRPPAPFGPTPYLERVQRQLSRCVGVGVKQKAADELWTLAVRAARNVEGRLVPRSASHGDLLPPNVLVTGRRIGVIDFEDYRDADYIYEDLGLFVAYLLMLEGSPLYSKRTLQEMRRMFLEEYGAPLDSEVLNLYVVKGAMLIVADTEFGKPSLLGALNRALLRKHFVSRARDLLQAGPNGRRVAPDDH